MELKSNPGRRFSPSKGHTQLDPGLTGQGGAFQFQVGNSSSQSSVVSKHFCFAAESSGRGAELHGRERPSKGWTHVSSAHTDTSGREDRPEWRCSATS